MVAFNVIPLTIHVLQKLLILYQIRALEERRTSLLAFLSALRSVRAHFEDAIAAATCRAGPGRVSSI
jgi:hypothetical protein